MNKKGQLGWGITIIVMISLFLIGMLSINFLKDEVTRARSSAGLNCSGNISDGTKITCLVVDVVIPYFIVLVFAAVGGMITAKLVL